ncbi:DUF1501 domain-containing protein [Polystyrenella longa]|uniref:DUF1501 domain-containing protein n=1 Tax=Polystyrenella longa TaxID=2528007 RepID=UPI0011A60889
MNSNQYTRRDFLSHAGAAGLTASALSVTGNYASAKEAAAAAAEAMPKGKAEHCIFIWLGGGAGQVDTWDPKRKGDPQNKKPGSLYDSIDTAIPGTQVCQHLSRCAPILDRFNLVRTVHHDVIDEHAAATNRVHTGRETTGTIVYPSVGSIVTKQRGAAGDGVPAYVLMGYPNVTRGPGFLGTQYGYLYLTETKAGPKGISRPKEYSTERNQRREKLLQSVRAGYLDRNRADKLVNDYDAAVEQAQAMAGPEFARIFELDREPADLRNSYGSEFGQRCLLARRLLESGVRFVEVSHNLNFLNGAGWDVHFKTIEDQYKLIEELDIALSSLVKDLEAKKMLDKTLIVVGTEFGRPSGFDSGGGRAHQGKAFSMIFAGGGLNNGITIGETDELCQNIVSRPVSIPDFHATIHCALGINPHDELYDPDNRPVPITDGGEPIRELFS